MRRLGGPIANVLLAAALATPIGSALDRSAVVFFGAALVAATFGAAAATTRASALPRLAFSLFVVTLVHRLAPRLLDWTSPSGTRDSILDGVHDGVPVIVLCVAAVASARSDAGLALAGGLVAGVVGYGPGFAVAMVVGAAALALGDARRAETVRERLPLVALGILIGLCTTGLGTDLAATLSPSARYEFIRWCSPDPIDERAARGVLELGTLGASIAFARGRTWGALALPFVAVPLAWCSVHFRGPTWGGGCLAFGHDLARTEWWVVLLPTAMALLPWSPVLFRAIRDLRS